MTRNKLTIESEMDALDALCTPEYFGPVHDGFLSPCFTTLIFHGLGVIFILVFGVYRLRDIAKELPRAQLTPNFIIRYEQFLIISQSLTLVFKFIYNFLYVAERNNVIPVPVYDNIFIPFTLVGWLFSHYVVYKEREKGLRHNWIIKMWWNIQYCGQLLLSYEYLVEENLENWRFVVNFGLLIFVAVMLVLNLVFDHVHVKGLDTSAPKTLKSSERTPLMSSTSSQSTALPPAVSADTPELKSNFLSQIFLFWATPILDLGNQRTLEDKDLMPLTPDDSTKATTALFEKNWREEIQGQNPSLRRALWRTFGFSFAIQGILKLFNDAGVLLTPVVLNQLLKYVEDPSLWEKEQFPWMGVLFAVGLFGTASLQSVSLHRYFFNLGRIGNNIRSALIGAIYRKAFRQTFKGRQKSSTGEIVNLQAIDAGRFQMSVQFLHMIWSAPLQMVVALIELIIFVGWSGLAGFGVLVVSIPLTTFLGRKMATYSKELMDMKDKRAKAMNEVLQGIRVIKFFSWENSFSQKITALRGKEVVQLKWLALIRSMFFFVFFTTPLIVAIVTFAVYIASNVLTPSIAFTALSLFNLLRAPLILLPTVITSLVELNVSMKRIAEYLSGDEFDDYVDRSNTEFRDDFPVVIKGGSFEWEPTKPVLTNINLSVPRGSLIAIVGAVGAGKSSLLNALLGEISKTAGQVKVSGSVAYVSQQAWIQNESVKNNILFGLPYDDVKYKKVVAACELVKDFEILPGGDDTEVGEKGINLSGGQKQRISLARAAYSQADVYLLDDPLSAVDVHVGKNIFDNCLKNLLDKSTRILVTHNLNMLPMVDKIFVLSTGKIEEQGTFNELIRAHGRFQEILEELEKEAQAAKNKPVESQSSSEQSGPTPTEVSTPAKELSTSTQTLIRSRSFKSSVGVSVPSGRPFSKYDFDESENFSHQSLGEDASFVDEEINLEEPAKQKQQKKKKRKQDDTEASLQTFKSSLSSSNNRGNGGNTGNSQVAPIKTGQLIGQEQRREGTISWSTYGTFIKAIGGPPAALFVLSLFVLTTGASALSDWWVSYWSDQVNRENPPNDTWFYLGIYGAIGAGFALMSLLRSFGVFLTGLRGATRLHTGMLHAILRSPISFFDTTPIGRILNRLTKDISIVDTDISSSLVQSLSTTFGVITVFIVMAIATPIIFIILPTMIYFYRFVQNYYLQTSLDLQRLDSTSKSPIFALFGETLAGVITIRAFKKQKLFESLNEDKVDRNSQAWWIGTVANRWLTIRLETVGNLVVFAAAFFAVLEKENVPAGLVGLSITYALQLTFQLNMLVRMSAQTENNLVAVERCAEYAELPSEAPVETPNDPGKNWPSQGQIEIRDLSFRYRPGLPLVLNRVTCTIKPREKIGVVGRTGAGKSSLMLALFRFNEPEDDGGTIRIDGVDISKIGLNKLRRSLAIIPQEPVLFAGTIRSNLDPFFEYSDEELFDSLRAVSLFDYVTKLEFKLEAPVSENGENHSVGTRQLLCLARALLRKAKIIVMDEATASIDFETDSLIQKTIRREFGYATVLTIAHRINTILDSTRVIVLDQGSIVEFDTPQNLQANEKSIFYSLVKEAEKQQQQTSSDK